MRSFFFASGLDVDTAWKAVEPISQPLRSLSMTHVDREPEVTPDAPMRNDVAGLCSHGDR